MFTNENADSLLQDIIKFKKQGWKTSDETIRMFRKTSLENTTFTKLVRFINKKRQFTTKDLNAFFGTTSKNTISTYMSKLKRANLVSNYEIGKYMIGKDIDPMISLYRCEKHIEILKELQLKLPLV